MLGYFYDAKTYQMVDVSFKRENKNWFVLGGLGKRFRPLIYHDGSKITLLLTMKQFLHHVTHRKKVTFDECTCSLPMANQTGHEYSGFTCPACRDRD